MYLRADVVESLYYEAKCRIQDPIYGCVGLISSLYQQIHTAQIELAKVQAEIAFLDANVALSESTTAADYGLDDHSNYWIY